jgi:lysophospholipase L1-like esterase
MDWYEAEVRQLESGVIRRVNGNRPPVFYGSSSIRLWSTLAEDFDAGVLNLGFGGSTLEACDYFFPRLITPVNPRSLLLYAGDNDLGDGRSVNQVFGWFQSLADKVESAFGRIPFGFISVKPSPARFAILDRVSALNELVSNSIQARPGGYFVDVYSAMLDEKGKPRSEYFLEDGLHMSHEGYLLWSRLLEPFRHQIFTL